MGLHKIKTDQSRKTSPFIAQTLPVFAPVLLLGTLLSASILTSSFSSADTQSVNASVNVPDTCSISATDSGTATPTNPYEMVGGTYNGSVGTTTINVTCNDRNGYSLYAIGYSNDTLGSTSMIGTNPANTIPTGTVSDASVSNWAFKLTPVTTTFTPTILSDASGSFQDYHAIPSTNTKIATFTGDINISDLSTITATYAVGIQPYQAPDTYTGKVKYTLVHPNYASEDGKVYMQDVTDQIVADIAEGTSATFTDSRDGNDYTVKKINGQLWMTQNLRFTGTSVPAATSNVTTDAAMTYYSLDANDASYTDHCDSTTNGYNYACIKDSDNATTGVWYNYYAATAGTVSTNSNSTAATEDICPKNWHLPTGANTTASTDINKLVGNTTSGWQDPTSGLTAFGAVAGGRYYNGSLNGTGNGYWWSATAYGATSRYILSYDSSNGQFRGNFDYNRNNGVFVRCVYGNPTISDVTYMQDVTEKIVENTAEGASTTLADRRDDKTYTVKKINGQLWMTQNLRLTNSTGKSAGVVSATDSNFTGSDITMTNGTNFVNYTVAQYYDSGDTTKGVWYSFCAAAAKTGNSCNNSGTYTSSTDICPAGWHLPTLTDFQGIRSLAASDFAVTGGFYRNGSLYTTTFGYWWSATAYDVAWQYLLYYNSGSLSATYNSAGYKYDGLYIRCVRN